LALGAAASAGWENAGVQSATKASDERSRSRGRVMSENTNEARLKMLSRMIRGNKPAVDPGAGQAQRFGMRETLSDGVVTLHRYRLDDIPDLTSAAHESVDTVFPWLPWCHAGFRAEEAHAWVTFQIGAWDKRTTFEFVIRTATGEHVGGGGINSLSPEHPLANLGYWVRTSQQGKGYATRATRLLAQFGLTDVGLQRVEIVAAVRNLASLRVIEKSGAHFEGILRNRLVIHGLPHDAAGYSFTPSDLEGALADLPAPG
jgi:RimJ/RimL family protein N-acetyltransferase